MFLFPLILMNNINKSHNFIAKIEKMQEELQRLITDDSYLVSYYKLTRLSIKLKVVAVGCIPCTKSYD